MKKSLLIQTAAALIIALVAMTGCKKEEDWSDEIGDLQQRVESLEELSADLRQKMAAGYLVRNISTLSGGGYRIEFTSGSPINVSNAGSSGTTEIHIGENGNWIIDGTDTGIRAEGIDGTNGTNGTDGANGIDGEDGTNGADGIDGRDGVDGAPGADGRDGINGTDGITPHIGLNGNWYIGDYDTGVRAVGFDGANGSTPYIVDGYWYINGVSTGVRARGVDGTNGSVVTIGANGNWYIDGRDTGKPSRGAAGTNGTDGVDGADGINGTNGVDGINGTNGKDGTTPHIGNDGYWYIGTTNTGILAKGLKGDRGATGATGATGAAGADGEDGADGKDGDTMIAAIVNNDANGTVTIIMNDAAHTEYTFRKASTAVSFAILNAGTLGIAQGQSGVVRFAVNPSNAYISTDIAKWMLYDVNTGATPAHFTLSGIVQDGAAGQYTATIRCTAAPWETVSVVALKLNTGTAAAPAWVSSSAFRTGIAPNINMTTNKSGAVNIRLVGTGTATIDWGDGTEPETIRLTSASTNYPHSYTGASAHHIAIYGQNITQLGCYDIQLSSLDVSKNTALTYLDCHSNQLTSLDVTKNTALRSLYCFSNQLASLDVRNNTALTYLECSTNQLQSLDVSQNTKLTELNLHHNKLTRLDVRNNTALTYLNCDSNQLEYLDVTQNTELTELTCDNNQLEYLDVINNTKLYILQVQTNNFSAFWLNELFDTLHGNYIAGVTKTVYISRNPGTSGCNKSIATQKGWTVSTAEVL